MKVTLLIALLSISSGDESLSISSGDESLSISSGDESLSISSGDESLSISVNNDMSLNFGSIDHYFFHSWLCTRTKQEIMSAIVPDVDPTSLPNPIDTYTLKQLLD
jgi:hypothetical protein